MTVTSREMILAERLRQISVEGWTHAHDDEHTASSLEQAGFAYLYLTHAIEAPPQTNMVLWPFHPKWWKPSPSPIRNLVKAGALFLAESERYKRAAMLDEAERLETMAANVAAEMDEIRGL